MALGSIIGVGALLTAAAFTDTAETTSTFSTGGVDIAVAPAPIFAALNLTDAGAGEEIIAPLTVTNAGSLDLTYTMAAIVDDEGDEDLAEALAIAIQVVEDAEDCDADTTFPPGDRINVPNDATLDDVTIEERGLDADEDEILCFRVQVSEDPDDDVADLEVDVTFQFSAVQA